MLRRARTLLVLCALSTLCLTPVLYAEDPEPAPPTGGGDPVTQVIEWILNVLGCGDEFNPQHLPGG